MDFKAELLLHFKNDPKAQKLRQELDSKKAFDDQLMTDITQQIGKIILKTTKKIHDYQAKNYGSEKEFNQLGA